MRVALGIAVLLLVGCSIPTPPPASVEMEMASPPLEWDVPDSGYADALLYGRNE